ncbi:piggyBac transposable element-derived protein 4-like [Metopolophium dirhodum]|uniref:piggyBac transposable element-derived protein 4-like n=1 Tax=Metopolophium dirhodum TaxID=44670 RepID=UPI00298FDC1E|nr:piggyBac transposable element-derived protein 4-like [Metopolophium dirhodum]
MTTRSHTSIYLVEQPIQSIPSIRLPSNGEALGYHRQHNEYYNRPEDIERIIQELEDEDNEYDVLDDYGSDHDDDPDFEPEVIENSDHDSDSEEELDSPSTADEIEESVGKNFRFFIGKDGETLWANEPVASISKTKSKNIIKILPGPKGAARQCKTEIECFSQFFSLDIVDKIVSHTNTYIQWRKLANPNSRDRDFRLTNQKEIQAFFGALFLIASYSPGEFTTIDEMLVAFRGRCGFIQYMDKKPAKYGLKMYALCDARTFYTYNLEIYCGKQDTGPFVTSNKPYDIVTRLTEPIQKSKRNVTTDNWFSSYPLAENLLKNGLTFMGTLKKKQKRNTSRNYKFSIEIWNLVHINSVPNQT